MNKKILELLYRSFDAVLSSEEQQRLQIALTNSKELRAEKKRLSAMRAALSSETAQAFGPFFAQKVMRRITSFQQEKKGQQIFFEALFSAFRPAVAIAAAVLIALMSYNIVKSDRFSVAGAFAEPQVTIDQVFEPALPLILE